MTEEMPAARRAVIALPPNCLAEVAIVIWSTSDRPQRDAVSKRFDDVFAVVALLAAVAALWIAGEGGAGAALLAAGMISVAVVLRRRMRAVATTLAKAKAELDRVGEQADDARRDRAALE